MCSRCRNLHLAHIRMWAGDYTLSGLVGFELRCKTVGVVGTGAIGTAAARIFCVSASVLLLAALVRDCVAPYQSSVMRIPSFKQSLCVSNGHAELQ